MNSVWSSRLFSQSLIERSAGEAMMERAPRASAGRIRNARIEALNPALREHPRRHFDDPRGSLTSAAPPRKNTASAPAMKSRPK